MSWEEDKEYTESKVVIDPKPPKTPGWLKLLSYAAVGIACLWIGATVESCNNRSTARYNGELRRKIKEMEKNPVVETVMVPYTVLVPVTEEIKKTAPVTDVVATETVKTSNKIAPVTDVPEKETTEFVAGTPSEETQYKLKVATNPLTKKALAPSQVKVSDEWKVYWIEITRSDLAGLKPDDFKFFYDYINDNFEQDDCEFNIVVTDVPGLCFQCNVTSSEYIRGLCEIYAGIKKENSSKYYPYVGNGSCALRFTDSNQFEIQPFIKDKYGLEQLDDEQFYYYPEFNKEMFDKLMELQENAEFLWG